MSMITVFADVSCPFAHVGLHRLAARLPELGIEPSVLRVRAWPLEWVNNGAFTGEALAPKIEALRRDVAPELFAGFRADAFPATSIPALVAEAAAYRVSNELGVQCALALRYALFEQGADIGDAAVVASIVEPLGAPAPTQHDHDAIEADYRLGKEMGVKGSPHVFTEGGSFFCPTLDIDHDDAGYHIAFDAEGFDAFMASLR